MFCGPQICQKCVGGLGSALTPLEKLTTLPRPLSRLERGHPIPSPCPLGVYGASILAPSALSFCASNIKSWLRPCIPDFTSLSLGVCRERVCTSVSKGKISPIIHNKLEAVQDSKLVIGLAFTNRKSHGSFPMYRNR